MNNSAIEKAKDHFGQIIEDQLGRIETMKKAADWIDYSQVKPIIVGVISGDGIGPSIAKESRRILEFLLQEETEKGKVKIRDIEGNDRKPFQT